MFGVGSYAPGTSSGFRPLLRTSCGPSGTVCRDGPLLYESLEERLSSGRRDSFLLVVGLLSYPVVWGKWKENCGNFCTYQRNKNQKSKELFSLSWREER
uniref:Uncharacterized protein n=1 Tax=Timema genevievae TaxID=629358 RepID=A0A7R9K1C2_TIMGE|nr:unnamed protein product [Timema genevievae]